MGLTLTKQKTEATVLRGSRKCRDLNIKIDDTAVTLLRSLNYLGVQINNKWNFHEHVNKITSKARSIIRMLGQITPRIGENHLESVNRKLALMVTGAYRTSPTAALLVLAKIPPIKLLVEKRTKLYQNKTEIKNDLTEKWNATWENYDGHTKILIPNLLD